MTHGSAARAASCGSTRAAVFRRWPSGGIGTAALATLLERRSARRPHDAGAAQALSDLPHFAPKAKRVIYLFQSGGPSQMDLFDYKPRLNDLRGTELPASIRMGQRLTGMTSTQATFPVAPPMFKFAQHGQSGAWVSELLPHTAKVADDLCFIKSMHTEAINHDPGITFFQTGAQLAGRPSIGSWISYGLGKREQRSSGLCGDGVAGHRTVRRSAALRPLVGQRISAQQVPGREVPLDWRSGAVSLESVRDSAATSRRRYLDDLAKLNEMKLEEFGDPEIATRIAQYEMAYRMQSSVPELTDLSKEPERIFELYGPDSRKPGTFAANCLLARRLAERGVRFIQLFHRGWDQHNNLPKSIVGQCRDTDQACAALIQDLKDRGLLEDTLVVWGGEFGRTVYCQGKLTADDYGRDHHPRCFTMWMAGGGVKPGITYGETDDYCYNITKDPVHVHDLHATILRCLGIDHTQLTFKYQGRHFRLTDVHGVVKKELLTS